MFFEGRGALVGSTIRIIYARSFRKFSLHTEDGSRALRQGFVLREPFSFASLTDLDWPGCTPLDGSVESVLDSPIGGLS
jgi:hypothetical protein